MAPETDLVPPFVEERARSRKFLGRSSAIDARTLGNMGEPIVADVV